MKAWVENLIRRQPISFGEAAPVTDERLPALSTLRDPPIDKIVRERNRLRRMFVLVAALGGLAAGPLAVAYDLPTQEGFGIVLLVAHDWIYLPLRGWAWTTAFPWNLTIWAPVFVVTVLLAMDWVSGVSPLQSAQNMAIRRGLTWPLGRWVFDLWHRWAGRRGFRAQFLEKIIDAEISSLLDKMHDVWVDLHGADPLAGRVAQVLLWSRISTRYGALDQNLRVQCQLLTALAVRLRRTAGFRLQSGSQGDPEFQELAIECRRLLALSAVSSHDAPANVGVQRLPCLNLLQVEPAIRAAEFALALLQDPMREDAQTREHVGMLYGTRIALAILAAETEKGRPAETVPIATPDEVAAGESVLALYLTAIIVAGVARPDLTDETMGLLDEIERVRFAAAIFASRTAGGITVSGQLKDMLAAYEAAGRCINLNRMRAALDMRSFAVGSGPKELAGAFPTTDGVSGSGRGAARARGDLWAMSGVEGSHL